MFFHVFQGIFYGATSTKPFVIPVPVQDGVQGGPTLDHLDVNYWVKQYGLGVYMTACRQLCCTFDRVPHTPGALDRHYTVFFERPAPATPRNRLVRKMVRLNGCMDVIKGSVLVMKDGLDGLIDMTHDDIVHTNFLINRWVQHLSS